MNNNSEKNATCFCKNKNKIKFFFIARLGDFNFVEETHWR